MGSACSKVKMAIAPLSPISSGEEVAAVFDHNAEDITECSICLCELEEEEERVALSCKHTFHKDCLKRQIEAGQPGENLSFQFMCCALCRKEIDAPELNEQLVEIKLLKAKTDNLALERVEKKKYKEIYESKAEKKSVKKLSKEDKLAFAYRKLLFYQCSRCKNPFCGGAASCARLFAEAHANHQEQLQAEQTEGTEEQPQAQPPAEPENKEKLCLECLTGKTLCSHPVEEMTFKCIKCCAPSTYYCLGTEFYCDRCHSDLYTVFPCPGPGKCPLGIVHPPNCVGTHGGGSRVVPFVLACGICGPANCSYDASNLDNFRYNYNG